MSVALSHSFITVEDQDEALGFYRDQLGLEVRADIRMGPMRWLTLECPGVPGVEIALETPQGRPGDADALRAVIRAGALTAGIFRVDDVDAIFARLTAGGAPVVQEPTDQPYGVRDCAVRDPSGNMVRLAQPSSGS